MTYLPMDPWLVGVAGCDGIFTVPKYKLKTLQAEWFFDEKMILPIVAGQTIGYMELKDDKGKIWGRVDIEAQNNINEKIKGILGFLAKLNIV